MKKTIQNSIQGLFAVGLLAASLGVQAGGFGKASFKYVDTDTTVEQSVEEEASALPIEALSVEEEQGIIFMREEEKLARDVYLTLYEQWGLSIFKNIAKSEQSHMEALKVLIDKYQIADPVIDDTVGVFTDYHFVEVFEALTGKGAESLEAALQVGTQIEELDIKDIAEAAAQVEGNDDIVMVYDELMKGSRNHLRSFWDVLTQNGFTYEPQYITQEEFDAIINSPMEQTNLR
jgi:hypothetical protein